MRNYVYRSFDETTIGIHGTPVPAFGYERNLYKDVNPTLVANFNKVAEWIGENCPTLNGEFNCRHDVYHWTRLVVEDGKAFLEYGSHGYGFELAMSTTETAVFTRGSMQSAPYAFRGKQFAVNAMLEEFLSQWPAIKGMVESAYVVQSNVYSEDFTA